MAVQQNGSELEQLQNDGTLGSIVVSYFSGGVYRRPSGVETLSGSYNAIEGQLGHEEL